MNQLSLDIRQERVRLSKQCEAILGRLHRGAVMNSDLALISLKYTGRISDLRKRGHDIRVIQRDYKHGNTWYALFVNGKQVP